MAARHGRHGVKPRGCERIAVLHHARRRPVSRDRRRLQPLRPDQLRYGGRRQDPDRRQDDLNRHIGLVRRLVSIKKGLLAVIPLTVLAVAACGYPDPYTSTGPVANESPGPAAAPSPSPGTDDFNAGAGLPVVTYPDGLKYVELTVGTGTAAQSGDNITVQYTGWLSTGGQPFDSSRPAGRTPFTVQIGRGQVIPGWDEGIPGMTIGGT